MRSVNVTIKVTRCCDCPEFMRGRLWDGCNLFGGWDKEDSEILWDVSHNGIDDRCPLLKESE